MFKFIVVCAVASLCLARSLNDDNTPAVLAIEEKVVVKPKDISVDDIVDESDLAAAIDSNSGDIIDSDKTRGLFRRFTTTTTSSPMMPNIELVLNINSVSSARRTDN